MLEACLQSISFYGHVWLRRGPNTCSLFFKSQKSIFEQFGRFERTLSSRISDWDNRLPFFFIKIKSVHHKWLFSNHGVQKLPFWVMLKHKDVECHFWQPTKIKHYPAFCMEALLCNDVMIWSWLAHLWLQSNALTTGVVSLWLAHSWQDNCCCIVMMGMLFDGPTFVSWLLCFAVKIGPLLCSNVENALQQGQIF